MVRLGIALFLYALIPAICIADQASIRLSTENAQVFVGDAIIIDIESTGLLEPLNVEPLKAVARFDRETYGTRIAVIEGKVVEIKIRRMEFTANKSDTLIFGPLAGIATNGDITSNAISIQVSEASVVQWTPSEQDVALEFTLNNSAPFIHEQIVADMVLKHRYPVADESIQLPDFSQFDVVPVFEQRRTLDQTDSGWRLISWRWLIHPKVSGEIAFNGPAWSGLMVKSRTQRGQFSLEPKATKLAVKPATTAEGWWLPAKSVSLKDSWSSPVIELSAGDEVIRTVTLSATGVLSQQIPDVVPLASRAISSVLISSQREQTLIENTMTSTAVFKFRMTAQSPIPVFLDTIRVPWWNTIENKMSESIVPARRINVGLPQRADVLANLALRRSPWERLKLYVRSSGVDWKLPTALLALLIAAYVWLTRSNLAANWFRTRRNNQRIRKINHCVKKQQWSKAWKLLESAPNDIRDTQAFRTIKAHCELRLFGQPHPSSQTNASLPLLQIEKTKKTTDEYLPPISI